MSLNINPNSYHESHSSHSAFDEIRHSCIEELATKGFYVDVYLLRGGVGVRLLEKDHPPLAQIAHLPIIEFDFDYSGQPSLEHLSFFSLQGLRLSQSSLTTFSKLEQFNLRKLYLNGVQATDFESLSIHPLIELSLQRTKVKSLQFLAKSCIEVLFLSQTGITNSELRHLDGKKIRKIDFFKCQISDLSSICQDNLEELVISGSQVDDLSPLSGYPLKKLEMRATKIESLTPISNCPIEILHLPGSRISCLQDISYCPIIELNLIGLNIEDLSPLLNMPIKKLSISRDNLNGEQIEILEQLDLEVLQSPNDPKNQKPIDFFRKIKEEK